MMMILRIIFLIFLCGLQIKNLQAQCSQLDSLNRLKILYEGQGNSTQLLSVYNALAKAYAPTNKLNSFLFANKAYTLASSLGDRPNLARALLNRANVQYQNDPTKLNAVIKDFEEAISICSKINDKASVAEVYANYGKFYYEISYTNKDFLDSAAKYYTQSYEIYLKSNKSREAAEVAGSAAEVYFEKGDESKALVFSEKSINSNDINFSKAGVIKKSLQAQINAQNWAFGIGVIAFFVLIGFIVLLIASFWQVRRANQLLQKQKRDLIEKNEEIEKQKKEIVVQNQEIQTSMIKLENSSKEIERQNRAILLQQTEIEMRNVELGEKNNELEQQQEEILAQRDTVENQAKELSEKAEKLQRSNETITILSRIGQTITSSLNLQEILNNFYVYASQLIPTEGFVLAEYQVENQQIEIQFSREFGKESDLKTLSMEEINNPIVWCIKNARNIWVNDREDLQKFNLSDETVNLAFNSMIFCPMLTDSGAIGAVGVYNTEEDVYNPQYLDTLKTLASYATIALNNAKTYQILDAAQEQLVEAEKMAALGGLVAGVAHEINTPVGICVTAASKLSSKTKEFNEIYQNGQMKRKDLADFISLTEEGTKILLSNLTRAADLVQGFKRVAVEQSTENQRIFNLKTYLEETILALKPEVRNRSIDLVLEAEEIEINSYAGAFSQIVTNLVMNSLIHGFRGKESGKINLQAKTKNKNLILTYQDNGLGMTPEVLSKIYEPFFTTNRDGGGTGLGMNIVYNLAVQKLGGKVNVESELNEGVTFTFEIPLNVS